MRLLAALLLSTLSGAAVAECQCLWRGSFTDVQADTDLVVSGTVISGKGNSIDLSVDRRLRGSPGAQSTLRIWLKTGDYCRPEPELFPVGSHWVMALDEITEIVPGGFNPGTPNVSYGRVGDYSLSNCGGYWLSRSGAVVTGNLVAAPRWDREPKMTPVLLDLVAAFVRGEVGSQQLLEASREDPALKELMLDTRAFLRDSD
ncbi:MAG: delta-aminolevulinic acid dehydratase [Halioglobus sp.]|nr:delta-aminolevulinic acid dehydratase [Halioglobus sp.]